MSGLRVAAADVCEPPVCLTKAHASAYCQGGSAGSVWEPWRVDRVFCILPGAVSPWWDLH